MVTSGMAIHVAEQIAALKNVPVKNVLQATRKNTRFVYNTDLLDASKCAHSRGRGVAGWNGRSTSGVFSWQGHPRREGRSIMLS
ncbi:hypothetical protein TNCV_2421561 [Trichonephila clavipes]|nr:hypothetical protein TNCV_2421561 [Trichonephila clavipes]